MKRALPQRLLFAALFLAIGAGVLLTIAHFADPPARCEENGGTWVIDGRYCEAGDALEE